VLTVDGSINSRSDRGGTARARVQEQLDEVSAATASLDEWIAETSTQRP
jgi:argininosuccinate lyase